MGFPQSNALQSRLEVLWLIVSYAHGDDEPQRPSSAEGDLVRLRLNRHGPWLQLESSMASWRSVYG